MKEISATICKLSDTAPIGASGALQYSCLMTIFTGPLTGFGIKRLPMSGRLRRNGCSARLSFPGQLYFTKGDEHICRARRAAIRSLLST